jgi:hypothetical protein
MLQCGDIESKIIHLFKKCIDSKSKLYIITNGMGGWVEKSCSVYYPGLYRYLHHFTIISAQEKYSGYDMDRWKLSTFYDVVSSFTVDPLKSECINMVSIGDGSYEKDATTWLKKNNKNTKSFYKIIKLEERPNPDVLCYRMDRLGELYETILNYNGHLYTEVMDS